MPDKILNIAEKNSVAKEIVRHLKGNYQFAETRVCGQAVYSFPLSTDRDCEMLVTAVRGHLFEYDFKDECRKWDSVPPCRLFDAEIADKISADNRPIAQCLGQLARSCQQLNLWLDCDREGEAICFEVISVCLKSNPRLVIKRAIFSALTHSDISNALRNLSTPNRHMANAVMARIQLDLRSGAAFTRYLTMRYQSRLSNQQNAAKPIISYGPCQFPTLGIIFDRWSSIQQFKSEPFWTLDLRLASSTSGTDALACTWGRGRIFDELIAHAIFERCARSIATNDGLISVKSLMQQPRSRWRPLPLNTVEMTKLASSKLHISSHRCMHIAESLYTKGLLSYPRTETDMFHETIDTRSLVAQHTAHSMWGSYCNMLLSNGQYVSPRRGQKNDNAHPPIHPVKSVEQSELEYDDWRLYELITRHFLAVCSPDAKAMNTNVSFHIDQETFSIDGLAIVEKNWLEVFHYEKWSSSSFAIPPSWRVGSLVLVDDFGIGQSSTTAPLLLSESELIAQMDNHGIGTDATMHEHIRTVQERNYVSKTQTDRFQPTSLGIALCTGFRSYAEAISLIKPDLRSAMETDISAIANGSLNPVEFLTASVRKLRDLFNILTDCPSFLDAAFSQIPQMSRDTVPPSSTRLRGRGAGRGGGHRRGRGFTRRLASTRRQR